VLSFLRSQRAPSPEDTLGDVFVCAVRDIGSFEGSERDLRSWLLRIARNRLIDAARAERTRPRCASTRTSLEGRGEDDAQIERVIEQCDELVGMERLLHGLSARQRAVVYLRFVLDLDQRATAVVLSVSVPAVKMAQRRALHQLARTHEHLTTRVG
jgi:RNA polymerase sigma factor (sigma-70 family)